MKKHTLMIVVVSVLSLAGFVSCGGEEKKLDTPVEITKEQYQCPMKCTEEIFDKPGTCPVCGMDLEKITKS